MSESRNPKQPIRFGFFLVPNFSMIAFSTAVEPLRMANRLRGEELYQWPVITADGQPVAASNGLELSPNCPAEQIDGLDAMLVCAGAEVEDAWNREIAAALHKGARHRVPLGALCTGSYLLARAELINDYRATIHWERLASLREQFPRVLVSTDLFVIDRDRYTCSGGTASLDMMLNLITMQHDADLAAGISEQFTCERIRGHQDRQRVPLRLLLGSSQPKLVEAVTLMEANIEEPISLDELGSHVGVSRRQLERIFQRYLNCVPTRYYLELRLKRARELLLQTSMSIVDVGFACGFVSAPHFSKCYRDFFGIPPRDERRLRGLLGNSRADSAATTASR
jgi:transcriptional regulator GlxA family with amidase domain